jgi:hypothetical protein
MTPRRITTLRIDEALLDGLQEVWHRDGILVAEQVRRAIQAWLSKHGIEVTLESPRQGRRPWDDDERAAMVAWDAFSDLMDSKPPKLASSLRVPDNVYPPLTGKAIRELSYAQLKELTRFLGRLSRPTSKLATIWALSRKLPKRED